MTRVLLITGGAGYIGSRLIQDLALDPLFDDCLIRIYDNLQRETYRSLLDLPAQGRYQFVEGDILDGAGLSLAMRDVWAVVHLAAIVRTPLAFGPPGWVEQVNHWGTAAVGRTAAEAGVAHLIYTSSAAVYGPVEAVGGSPVAATRPLTEEALCRPLGPYAESKLRGERELGALQQAGSLKVIILRLGSVFGWAPAVRFDAVANRLAFLAGVRRPLTVYGSGEQRRPLLHVADASQAIRFALTHSDQMAGGVYNVVSENARVLDVVAALQSLQPAAQVRFTEQDVLTHLSFAVDGSRLNALGWYPQVSLEAGLAELLDHLRGFLPFGVASWGAEEA
jgi:UDP-glucose 4-epimerase